MKGCRLAGAIDGRRDPTRLAVAKLARIDPTASGGHASPVTNTPMRFIAPCRDLHLG